MCVLLLFALLPIAVGAPSLVRQMNIDAEQINNLLALNITRKHSSSPSALFIPHGEEPDGFDPTKPIQGAFFVNGDTEPFTMAKFRFPQKTLNIPPASDVALTVAPSSELKPARVLPDILKSSMHTQLSTAPVSNHITMIRTQDLLLPEQQTTVVISSLASALDEQQLITTTKTMPTASVIEQKLASSTTTFQPLPIVSNAVPVDKNVDLDGDGRLSLSEVQYAAFVHHGLSSSVVQGLFNEVDRNKDNFLDSAEFNNIRPLVLAKAENAALRYMQSVDTDKNKLLSLEEAQAYILKDHGIGSRDVERIWRLVVPSTSAEMDPLQFSKLRRRIRGMTIRLARQIMKNADTNRDRHISLDEAQAVAFEQEGIGAGDVAQMFASVDDNNDGELNAPEFADFERIVRSKAVETSKKALRVVDLDGSNTLTMDEGRRIAFEHYGFNENEVLRSVIVTKSLRPSSPVIIVKPFLISFSNVVEKLGVLASQKEFGRLRVTDLAPFFGQADENEDGHLDAVEFAGFRSVIRNKAVRNAIAIMKEIDLDGDGLLSLSEAEMKTKREDDMDTQETTALFNIADQNKSGKLDKVELADFIRLVRLSAIRFATNHFKEFDTNRDHLVTVDELANLIENKYQVPFEISNMFFHKVDVDDSGDLIPAEIVDFRHEIRKYVSEHLMSFVEQEQHEDKNLVENVDEITTASRRIIFASSIAPITTTINTTTISTSTFTPSTISKLSKRNSTISTNNTTITTSTTSTASTTVTATQTATTSDLLCSLTQSVEFPTLVPSTRRKVTFHKHTTITPQTNDNEHLLVDPGKFERENSSVVFADDKKSDTENFNGHRRNIWKNQRITTSPSISVGVFNTSTSYSLYRPTTTTTTTIPLRSLNPHIPVTLPRTSSTEIQRIKIENHSIKSAQTERLEEATTTTTTTTTTEKPTKKTTTLIGLMTTPGMHRTTRTTKTQVIQTTSPAGDDEYEIVEVEVDEDGNEILNEDSEEESDDDIRRESTRKSFDAYDSSLSHKNELQYRKQLVKEQKRALNLTDSTEVEYLDSQTTKRPNYDVDDYSEENPKLE